jgi:hypothetical protein
MSIAPVAHKEIDKLEEKPKQAAPELSRALHCTGWDAVEARRQTKSKRGEQRTAGQKLILHRLQQAQNKIREASCRALGVLAHRQLSSRTEQAKRAWRRTE